MSTELIPAWRISYRQANRGIYLDPGNIITVGEEGRARLLTRVPAPPGAVVENENLLVSIPRGRHQSAVALILIMDHSGYRGGWYLAPEATGFCPADPSPGDPYGPVAQTDCQDCGACAGEHHRIIPDRSLDPSDIGGVIAEGYKAQGIAGHVGGGPEYLIMARPGRFSIRRRGRLYGTPRILNVTVHPDGNVTVADAIATLRSRLATSRW